jgi:hypothetical protein
MPFDMKKLLIIAPIALALVACKAKKIEPNNSMGDVDASNFIAVGNGYVQGYMNDALYSDGQESSVANIITTQFSLVNAYYVPFEQYLIAEGSVGTNLNGDARLTMGYKTDCNGETSLSPVRASTNGDGAILNGSVYSASNPVQNFGIANADISYYLSPMFGPTNGFVERIAEDPFNKSLKDQMDEMNPTSFLYALGESQILNYAINGGGTSVSILPATGGAGGNDFESFSQSILSALSNSATTGAICTVPDVTDFPYFNVVPWNFLEIDSADAALLNQLYQPFNPEMSFIEGVNGFAIEDPNAPFNVRQIKEGELITLAIPLDSVRCFGMGSISPIPEEYILDSTEVALIKSEVANYNQTINDLAVAYDLAIADIYDLYHTMLSGTLYNGVDTNSEFVTGGFFSLDGRNPTPKGNAFIANEIIKAINQKYGAKIPFCDPGDYISVEFP